LRHRRKQRASGWADGTRGRDGLQIKVCVHEFNKVDKTSKVKRALRAGEYKESFEAFNVKLKCALRPCLLPSGLREAWLSVGNSLALCSSPLLRSDIVNDLTLATVTDAALFARAAAADARSAAEAERRDMAALVEEVRAGNAGLADKVVASDGSGKMAGCLKQSQKAALAALETLQAQAGAQQAQLRALAAQGLADATELSVKLDGIKSSAAAAAAASEENAAALAEDLACRHAEALASLEFVMTAANTSLSADVRREADKTRAAMAASQKELAAAADARRKEELAALDAVIKSGSAAAREAATELKDSMGDLKDLQALEMAALRAVARDTGELKAMMGAAKVTADSTLVGVQQLLDMMKAMQLAASASPTETPKQRQEAVLKALKACAARLAKTESALAARYDGCADAEMQSALKPLNRQVALLASSLAFLAEKTAMLPPDQAPRLAADDLVSAVEKSCAEITNQSTAAVAASVQAPLRFALGAVSEAHRDADAALRGAGADAAGDMPVGWARELWTHAFGRCIWSGARGALLAAVESYKGPAIDMAHFEPFVAQKQQDFTFGAGDRVDALEWRVMAAADVSPKATQELERPDGKLCGMAAQLAVDGLLAHAAAYANDDGFRVSVRLCDPAHAAAPSAAMLPRGMAVTLRPTACAVARINDEVLLEVTATRNCYFYLLEQDSGGALCPLLPNEVQNDANNKLQAHVARRVPDATLGDRFQITFTPPEGLERIVVFATLEPWTKYGSLASLADPGQRVRALTRGTMVSASKPSMAVCELRFTLLPAAR